MEQFKQSWLCRSNTTSGLRLTTFFVTLWEPAGNILIPRFLLKKEISWELRLAKFATSLKSALMFKNCFNGNAILVDSNIEKNPIRRCAVFWRTLSLLDRTSYTPSNIHHLLTLSVKPTWYKGMENTEPFHSQSLYHIEIRNILDNLSDFRIFSLKSLRNLAITFNGERHELNFQRPLFSKLRSGVFVFYGVHFE